VKLRGYEGYEMRRAAVILVVALIVLPAAMFVYGCAENTQAQSKVNSAVNKTGEL